MIIEIEERFCKAAKVFKQLLGALERSAERGDAMHEVEETTWGGLIETGREMMVAFIQQQDEALPRPEAIEYEGKPLRRLPERRVRAYVSAFGAVPFARDVYAARETQRQEVVPLDAKLGLPESDTSYLLQKWSGAQFVKCSYQESRITLQSILGFAPSVNCLEDMAAQASAHAEDYLDRQGPVEPATEAEIVVVTSDCKGVPMRKADAPRRKPAEAGPRRKRLKKGEKNGQKRMACVGGIYSVDPFRRTVEEVLDEVLRKEKQQHRPAPQNKRLRAALSREVAGVEVSAKDAIFDWLAKEVQQRDSRKRRTVVAIMDGETKLRDLQELKIRRAIGILDIWHVTEYLWELAHCFHREGSAEAEAFVEMYLGKILQGKVNRVIGGIRQMATKRNFPQAKWDKVEDCLLYFAARTEYMKYDEYLAAGYPIGSGVVEGACRHLVKDRMEQSGMRWRIAGAQAILGLRAIYVNEDWEAFQADRIQTEQCKLYPYKKCLNTILYCAT